jgi:hypothetical protein
LQRRGVDHESELVSRVGLKDVGRVLEHYGMLYSSCSISSRSLRIE